MKNTIWLLLIVLIIIAGCSNKQNQDVEPSVNNQTKEQNQSSENAQQEPSEDESEQEDDSQYESDQSDVQNNTDNGKESEEQKITNTLLDYRPAVGTEKVFTQNNEYEVRYNTIAANDQFVQRTIGFGEGFLTVQVLEWSRTQIILVYQEENTDSGDANILDSFESYQPPEVLVDINQTGNGGSADWEVTNDNESVTVPYGTFEQVYVVRQTLIAENSGQKTITTSYYAPGMGLIKEIVQLEGEDGFQVTTELIAVNK